MITREIKRYKRVLLLQGPMGTFFRRFGSFLEDNGAVVHKINLNGGDLIFYPSGRVTSFRERPAEWEAFVSAFIREKGIDCIFLFGDCRFYHKVAVNVAGQLGIAVYVFEEGYIRPDFITLEKGGVNGNSAIFRNRPLHFQADDKTLLTPEPAKTSFALLALSSVIYYIFGYLFKWRFPHYEHHKSFCMIEHAFYNIRSGVRKYWYRLTQRKPARELRGLENKYFLVPLQVHNDSQVLFHSDYGSIEAFIDEITGSFAESAKKEHRLVFKHHPMDRGHRNYSKYIREAAKAHGVSDRVMYVHDLRLPSLIKNALGVVVINSTVGLSAAYHKIPVKTLGRAVYDIPGITHQGPLSQFWKSPGKVNYRFFIRFYNYLAQNVQLNGSFYGRFPLDAVKVSGTETASGLHEYEPELASLLAKSGSCGQKRI